MRLRIVAADFAAELRILSRSKGVLFWTLLFPVMLILIFGAIFSGIGEMEYELFVQDLDQSEASAQFLDSLESTGLITITKVNITSDVDTYIKEENIKRLLIIPEDFSEVIYLAQVMNDYNHSVNLTFHYDQSEQSNQAVSSIISSVLRQMNMQVTDGKTVISMTGVETISGEFSFIDFFLPGMIGFTIMQTCIYGSIERNTKYRKDGILRKMLTTPITRTEWIVSKMLYQMFLSFISAVLIIAIGIIVYQLNIVIDVYFFILVISTSFLFTGMGMVVGRFVKDEESAGMAGGVITFPMMFLAGTFFALDEMPLVLQYVARVLPLYYVNEGFRNSMIYLQYDDALFHTGITVIMGILFFIAGIVLTKWKEE